MKPSKDGLVRAQLHSALDGMRVKEIADAIDRNASAVWAALRRMPDVYIDRWDTTSGGAPCAVWCVVEVPEDCPRPGPQRRRKK